MNSLVNSSVSFGQKIITGKIIIFILLGIVCVAFGLYNITRKQIHYNRIHGVVQKASCVPYGKSRVTCSLLVSYRIGKNEHTRYLQHKSSNSYFVGQPVELEYNPNNINDIYVCCKMSNKKIGFISFIGAIICFCIAFFDYIFRKNKIFAVSETIGFFQ